MVYEYSIHRSVRATRVRIAVHSDGSVVVSAPKRAGDEYISRVVEAKRLWIEHAVEKYRKMTDGLKLQSETVDRKEFIKNVGALVPRRAAVMGVAVKKLSIRKMRSRWGSCSPEGNVSINLLLGHLPDELLEYVVVHELCHLVHHNHSKCFWSLLNAYLPDYKRRKTILRKFGYLLRQKKPE